MWRQVACRLLLAIGLVCNTVPICAQNCGALSVTLKVGIEEATVLVPQLSEGATQREPCGKFFEGYGSFIEVFCVGGSLQGDSSRCTPQGCAAGQKAPVRIDDSNTTTLYATLVQSLAHGEDGRVPCETILDGYKEVIKLSCKLGKLKADAGMCRPTFKDAATVWRIVNGDALPGTWRIFELSFHLSPDCQSGKIEGSPVASSEDQELDGWKHLAFDRDIETAWSSHCLLGCMADTAWVGLLLPQASANIRCVRLQQSQVSCCSSPRVRLEVWDGNQFQNMQVWDTSRIQPVQGRFELPIPITCTKGFPEGKGIIHDCNGQPVVGPQAGDECIAECLPGYYGTPATYVCQPDGSFTGEPPTCYELSLWYNIGGFATMSTLLLLMAWQYQFWCMFKKVRITDEDVIIPAAMKGQWLEQHGRNVWDDLQEAIKNKERLEDEAIGKRIADEVLKASQPEVSEDVVHEVLQVNEGSGAMEPCEDYLEDMAQMVMVKGKLKEKPPQTDGLCTPCEDPDLFWACVCCPLCRIADTWHTLGKPKSLTYMRVFLMYVFCPWCWPCLNFYGRLRMRLIFGIPIEPHRDFLAHCCCACCCSPCAILQEARLADAPTKLYWARKRQQDALENAGE